MTAREDFLAGKIDRANAKAQTSARKGQVRGAAYWDTHDAVMRQSEGDRETYIRAAGTKLRELAGKVMGEDKAVGMFGGLAHSDDAKIKEAIARARLDQIARTLFRDAANENGGDNG